MSFRPSRESDNVVLNATRAAGAAHMSLHMSNFADMLGSVLIDKRRAPGQKDIALIEKEIEKQEKMVIVPSDSEEDQFRQLLLLPSKLNVGPSKSLTLEEEIRRSSVNAPKTDVLTQVMNNPTAYMVGMARSRLSNSLSRIKISRDFPEKLQRTEEKPKKKDADSEDTDEWDRPLDSETKEEGVQDHPEPLSEKKALSGKRKNMKGQWYPSSCAMRYTTPYPMPDVDEPNDATDENLELHNDDNSVMKIKALWCGCCMRESFDPYFLPCGHSFCRRCVLNINPILLKDYPKEIQDTRAVIRCPLKCCKAVIRCLPLINGDFRFKAVRPSDKVQPNEAEEINPCDQYRLRTYKIRLDMDLTSRKSDNLFDGYNDVVIIP